MADAGPSRVPGPVTAEDHEGLPPPEPAATRWLSAGALEGHVRDAALRSWLLTRGLLTARIREAAGDGFAMHCLREEAVGVEHVRETAMSCDGVVWMFAHTRMPSATVRHHPWLGRIGDRTLGEVLAGRSEVARGDLRYAMFPADSWLIERALRHAQIPARPLWVRHSPFIVGRSGFDLFEVFLPDIGAPHPGGLGGCGRAAEVGERVADAR
jgi:chorismate-pyruvate lyase